MPGPDRGVRRMVASNTKSGGLAGRPPHVQYVWDQRYIDAPVCRFRDADSNSQTGTSGLERREGDITGFRWTGRPAGAAVAAGIVALVREPRPAIR